MMNTALAIVAHPDDAEFLCAGTLALLHQHGWEIHIATMTAGDCGSMELGKHEISQIRLKEAARSAAILRGSYECLDFEDAFILYDRPSIIRTTALVRKVAPRLVLTMSPSDYMIDHEITSTLVQTACFCAGIVNIDTPGNPPLKHIPHLYYVDPLEGKDKFGSPVKATTIVDISAVLDIKTEMLTSHDSQREWLRQHHGMDEYVLSMKRLAEARGREIGVAFAEGFRQHLGHAYPQDNLILEVLKGYTWQV
jgi:LmbE family N-acetylglucosaminyl deacetylase